MIIGTFMKQPAEVRRVSVNFATEYLAAGETISGATCTSLPTTSPALDAVILTAYPATNMLLSVGGGSDGEAYMVTIRATTSFGQVVESEIVVNCEEIAL
ncbi:hypothetical protein UFOVP470_14 [uncultured Caudovirales phage]|uniref:Uncharacterized protein n=1 Tax=uncultured Caudovirales phage TaxID=2100421 RepID=A0A6J5MAM3_9CAUD|nr:hypothetical protein UFOVP470_14 [uncultured Caudovirales phage]